VCSPLARELARIHNKCRCEKRGVPCFGILEAHGLSIVLVMVVSSCRWRSFWPNRNCWNHRSCQRSARPGSCRCEGDDHESRHQRTRDAVTTDEGAYIFDLLPPASIALRSKLPGFRKSVFDHAQALIGKQTEINIRLDHRAGQPSGRSLHQRPERSDQHSGCVAWQCFRQHANQPVAIGRA